MAPVRSVSIPSSSFSSLHRPYITVIARCRIIIPIGVERHRRRTIGEGDDASSDRRKRHHASPYIITIKPRLEVVEAIRENGRRRRRRRGGRRRGWSSANGDPIRHQRAVSLRAEGLDRARGVRVRIRDDRSVALRSGGEAGLVPGHESARDRPRCRGRRRRRFRGFGIDPGCRGRRCGRGRSGDAPTHGVETMRINVFLSTN